MKNEILVAVTIGKIKWYITDDKDGWMKKEKDQAKRFASMEAAEREIEKIVKSGLRKENCEIIVAVKK